MQNIKSVHSCSAECQLGPSPTFPCAHVRCFTVSVPSLNSLICPIYGRTSRSLSYTNEIPVAQQT
jgi:hypothetical protein